MAVIDVTSSYGNARNEVYQYEMGRYISSNVAVWRILNFLIHERYPTVIHLCPPGKRTECTSQKDSKNKRWSRRKIGQYLSDHPGIKSTDAIGRVYTVHPNNSECFHLRLLLHEVPGPTSFQYLKTIEGRICCDYKEACQVRGLTENDEHWNATLEKAAFVHSPRMLRDKNTDLEFITEIF
ncbi:ATP-dependent DNA helicase [Trichonephila clavipes]|nr:ATP-dependent DNA helicase [Trichonephila clavipes]